MRIFKIPERIKDWICIALLSVLVVSFVYAQETTEDPIKQEVPCDMNWKVSHRHNGDYQGQSFIYQPCSGRIYRLWNNDAYEIVYPGNLHRPLFFPLD